MVFFFFFFYVLVFFVSALLLKTMFDHFKNSNTQHHYRLPPSPRALPVIGHMHLLDRIPYKSFEKLCNRYGPLIYLRLGSIPCVVASSPELAKELLMSNELSFASRHTTLASHHLTYDSSGFAFVPYSPFWKFAKKTVMSLLLGGRTLTQLQPIRTDELQRLVRLLMEKSKAGETVNLSEEFMKFSNNVISRMALSIRYSGKDDQAREARDITREVTEIFGLLNLSDLFGFLRNIDLQRLVKRSKMVRRRFDALLERILKEREEIRKEKKKRSDYNEHGVDGVKDFLDILLDIAEDETAEIKLTRNNIKAITLDLFAGGTDTTATALEWAMAELYNHPTVFDKARHEIDSVVGKNRLIEESDVPNLPYLQAVVKETLRLHPPIPMLAREARQDCKIAGYDIPAKTSLFVNVWSINKDPKYWEDPLEFRPERFLKQLGQGTDDDDETAIPDVKGQHFNLLPFGTGRRGCPGIWLALREITEVAAAIIQCFDWKLPGDQGDEQGRSINGGKNSITTTKLDMTERPGLTAPREEPLMFVPVIRLNPFSS